ncbi:MAG: asparagine synthase-related protein [Alphaproteobacteria bacterium]
MQEHLPSFTLSLTLIDAPEKPEFSDGVFSQNQHPFTISHNNMAHILEYGSDHGRTAIILGSPIIHDRVDRQEAVKTLLASDDLQETIKSFNGEFLVVLWDSQNQNLSVVTDRYSSYPSFWAQSKTEFCLSYNYVDLARHCVNWPEFHLLPERAYEFFILQRLMGQETHDSVTRAIAPASILTISADKEPISQYYWRPNYKKNNTASKAALLKEFTSLFAKAVKVRSDDDKHKDNIGIFLSGGHDSRLVATYADTATTCYTLSFKNNLEVSCAEKIAKVSGHDHIYCGLDSDFFEKTLEDSTYISGALFATDHALFIPSGMTPPPHSHIYLHGHGLDFMYQGMYLHARPLQLSKRDTYIKRFVPLPKKLTDYFIKTIPFRSRYNMRGMMVDDIAQSYHDVLYQRVEAIETTARELSDAPMDQWEYMVFHHPSRHYTFSNVLSKRICGELRTPSFDNALYDFYLSLPFKYRLHGDMLRGALFKKNPKIARMPTANHGLPAAWGPYAKTAATIIRKLLKHATFNTFFHPPNAKDRTWPDRDTYFRDHPEYYQRAISSLDNVEFRAFLNFMDWDKLTSHKEDILNEKFGGVFLVALLSYYEFYKAIMSQKK